MTYLKGHGRSVWSCRVMEGNGRSLMSGISRNEGLKSPGTQINGWWYSESIQVPFLELTWTWTWTLSLTTTARWKLNYEPHLHSCFYRLMMAGTSDTSASAWSSVKDKLVFILVHDEVIIKLPQKRWGESSSEFLLYWAPKQSCLWFYRSCVKNWCCFQSVIKHVELRACYNFLSYYRFSLGLHRRNSSGYWISSEACVSYKKWHESCQCSAIFSSNCDALKSYERIKHFCLNHKEHFKRFKYQIFIS